MNTKYKVSSFSLSVLLENLQNLIINDSIKSYTPPILETNGKFTSLLNTTNYFNKDKLLNDNLDIETEDEDFLEKNDKLIKEKEVLTKQATNKVKEILSLNNNLQDILNKIQKLSDKQLNSDDWVVNDMHNTASLKSKKAQIFIQNNNICLSHDGKIEIFNSVKELHDWLKENQYPLPKNITLHEAKDDDTKPKKYGIGRAWWDLLGDSPMEGAVLAAVPITVGDKAKQDSLSSRYKTALDRKGERASVDINGQHLYRGDSLNQTEDEIKKDLQKQNDAWLTRVLGKPLSKKDLQNSNSSVKDDEPISLNPLNTVDSKHLTLRDILKDKESDDKEVEECTGATVSSSLGSATQYLAHSNKKIKESTILLEITGYPNTRFADKIYRDKYYRASEYLDFAFQADANNRNDLINQDAFNQALEEYKNYQIVDRGGKDWKKLFKNVEIEDFVKRIREINATYNLDLNPNYPLSKGKDGSFITKDKATREGILHNEAQRDKWIKGYWLETVFPTILRDKKRNANNRKDLYLKNIEKTNTEKNITPEIKLYIDSIVGMHDTLSSADFYNKLLDIQKEKDQDTFKLLLNELINAGSKDNPEIDASDLEISIWKNLLNSLESKKESIFETTLEEYYKNKINSLKEDDDPADFATGTPLEDLDTTDNISVKSNSVQTTDDNNFDDSLLNIDSSIDSSNDFGIMGDYSPSGDTSEEEIIPNNSELYKVLDILIDKQDPSNVKLKLKNLTTNEMSIKDINEVDI